MSQTKMSLWKCDYISESSDLLKLQLTNIKHFPCWYTTVYQHEWKLGKREIVWKHDECFHTISSFPNFHECWYNCISIRKKCFIFVLYLFYDIAQRNIKKEIFRRFRVELSYINTALSQSAFRIYKWYIIIYYIFCHNRLYTPFLMYCICTT
jgi:hypothetical protein